MMLHTVRPTTDTFCCVRLLPPATPMFCWLIRFPPLSFPVPFLCSFFDRLVYYFQDRPFDWSESRKGMGSYPSEPFLPLDLPDGWIHRFGGWLSGRMNEWMDKLLAPSMFVIPYLPSVFPIPLVYFLAALLLVDVTYIFIYSVCCSNPPSFVSSPSLCVWQFPLFSVCQHSWLF